MRKMFAMQIQLIKKAIHYQLFGAPEYMYVRLESSLTDFIHSSGFAWRLANWARTGLDDPLFFARVVTDMLDTCSPAAANFYP